jgi:hypothetical protein
VLMVFLEEDLASFRHARMSSADLGNIYFINAEATFLTLHSRNCSNAQGNNSDVSIHYSLNRLLSSFTFSFESTPKPSGQPRRNIRLTPHLKSKTICPHILEMAARRAAGRSLLGLRRETADGTWTPFPRLQAVQSRSISYTKPHNTFPCTPSNILPRRVIHMQYELFPPSNSSAARRTFSATRAVAHGDWSPPKAGEEYVRVSINGGAVLIEKQTLCHIYR